MDSIVGALTEQRDELLDLTADLDESKDAKEVAALTQKEGSKTALVDGDLRSADDCRAVVDRAVREFGGVAILESDRGRKCKAA